MTPPLSRLGPALVVVALLGSLCGCGGDSSAPEPPRDGPNRGAPAPTIWFEDAIQASGIDFVHRSGHTDRHLLPEITSGGGALLDADGDGHLDVYLVQAGGLRVAADERPGNQLYLGRGDGTFRNVSETSGADDRGYGMGVAVGDYDGDGDPDLYVTNLGPDVLLRNDGGGRFTDVTVDAGLGDPGWGTSAAFVDLDRDGDLDLFVVRYLNWRAETEIDCENLQGNPDYCGPTSYRAPTSDLLYRNDGAGSFTDVSSDAGLATARGNGLGIVCGDFDGDTRPDVFVANDQVENHLWLNRGSLRFEESALISGCAMDQTGQTKAGMGTHAVDADDDGDLDLLVVNITGESDSFFRNEGDHFQDGTAVRGLGAASRPFTRFGVGLVDFDNDGTVDLFIANGRVSRKAERYGADPYAEPNQVFRGGAEGRFEEVVPRGGTGETLAATSRAACFGDVDGDGGVDVLVVNKDRRPHLLLNRIPHRGNWVAFRVRNPAGSDAIGATVSVRVGGRQIRRDVRSAYSYLAASEATVRFGLGSSESVDDVSVRRPDGSVSHYGAVRAGRIWTLPVDGPARASKVQER